MKYRVIKEIPDGWEGTAKIGDVLTEEIWEGFLTLMKRKKAICDKYSEYGQKHCEPMLEKSSENI